MDHEAVTQFWQDGFARIPGLYSQQDVCRFRAAALNWHRAKSKGGHQGLLSINGLSDLLTDAKIASIARDILGDSDLICFGDSNVNVTCHSPRVDEFHRDNVDRWDGRGPD